MRVDWLVDDRRCEDRRREGSCGSGAGCCSWGEGGGGRKRKWVFRRRVGDSAEDWTQVGISGSAERSEGDRFEASQEVYAIDISTFGMCSLFRCHSTVARSTDTVLNAKSTCKMLRNRSAHSAAMSTLSSTRILICVRKKEGELFVLACLCSFQTGNPPCYTLPCNATDSDTLAVGYPWEAYSAVSSSS